jgi:hypothetical protein
MGINNEPTKILVIPELMESAGYVKKREWQGLTAQDLADVGLENIIGAIWADQKLKEKNHG